MKDKAPIQPAAGATGPTLQTVLDRLADKPGLSNSTKRDLRSAVTSFARLLDENAAAIALDLGAIRQRLDSIVPAAAKISPKRFANLRSDLGQAIDASGLGSILKTRHVELHPDWTAVLDGAERRLRTALSRFARWATLNQIAPTDVDSAVRARFIGDLEGASLVRNLPAAGRSVSLAWNALVTSHQEIKLRPLDVPATKRARTETLWEEFLGSLRSDLAAHVAWAAVPDPLAEGARARTLSPMSLRLRESHVRAAARAAVDAGIPIDDLTSLARLVELQNFRSILGHRWKKDGRRLSAFTHGLAVTLIAIAEEWVKLPASEITRLKELRSKLGMPSSGLTAKNKALLRAFEDPRAVASLLQLPDRLWHAALRELATSQRAFPHLQTALALDLLIHVPMRLQNLTALQFDHHVHCPLGPHKPALITLGGDETKNSVPLEFEIPAALADRLWRYRTEIAPAVIGRRPEYLFVNAFGARKTSGAIKIAIEKAVLRHVGVKITPHQYRHLAAKLALDANPGAYELVRQLLGHKNLKTTTNFYAGIDTRRAGRAHADLVMRLREARTGSRASGKRSVS